MTTARHVLLDECVPRTLKQELRDWHVDTVRDIGWAGKLNGDLLRAADGRYDIFVTVDRRLVSQQNLSEVRLAIVVLVAYRNSMRALRPLVGELQQVLGSIRPGEVVFIPR